MRCICFPIRTVIFLLIALSCPISATATPVPRDTIEQLAQIDVERYEISQLKETGKLTPEDYATRHADIEKRAAALWFPYDRVTSPTTQDERQAAMASIQGLSRAKLAILEPGWRKERENLQEAARSQQHKAAISMEQSAAKAGHIQQQRLTLQHQLDKGTIDRDTFNAKDRQALADIEALRNKNTTGDLPLRFDERMAYYTKTLIEKPKTVAHPTVVKPPPVVFQPPPPPADTSIPTWMYVVGGIVVFLVLGAIFGQDKAQPAPAPPPTSGIHGTARWAKYEERAERPKYVETGVFFGKSSKPSIPESAAGGAVASGPENHTLIVARTRAGKGTRVIVPTLLAYRYSMLVIDPKGENAAITARTRRDRLKQKVHIINPWGELKDVYSALGFESATFNPLDAIVLDDPNAVAVAQNLAATMCPVTDDKDKFWQGSAANVLAGVLLWISDHPSEQKTLARAREIITQSRADFKRNTLTKMMVSTAFGGAIKEMVSQYYDLADDTYSGIMSNLAESTKFLSDPQIKAATATSSFSMEKIRDVYMTVFIVIPHDRIQTHATWLRLVISSAMQAIKNRSRIRTPAHHRCMFLVDEFGSIGHIADVPRDIAIMAGFGLDLTLIVQGLDQLKHHYGEAAKTILSNCSYKWFCYVGDLETAKYLSETLGKKTVRTTSTSTSHSATNRTRETEGESTTHGEAGRDLLTPDEILNLGRDVAVLLNPITYPGYLRTIDYWRLRGEFPDTYPPDLKYDDNPYRPPTRLITPAGSPPEVV